MFQHWKHHSYNVLYDHPVFKQRNMHNTCFKNTVLWITFRIEQRAVGPQRPTWRSRHGNPYWSPGICLSFLSTYHWGKHLVFIITLPPCWKKVTCNANSDNPGQPNPTTGFIFFCRITDAASSVAHTPGQRLLQQLLQTQLKQKKKTCQNTKAKALKLCWVKKYLSFLWCCMAPQGSPCDYSTSLFLCAQKICHAKSNQGAGVQTWCS